MQRVSVVILTKNEEQFVERAIRSVEGFADEVILIDSNSVDGTRKIAEAAGATVHSQDWLGWVGQRRRGAELARNDWLFFLDADEIVTAKLSSEICRVMAGNPCADVCFSLEREDEFLGHLMFNMKRSSKRSAYVRLYNRTRANWRHDQLVHEEVECPGEIVRLAGTLLHWRNYKIFDQIATYNRYSELEAQEIESHSDSSLALRLIFKPLARFIWIYFKSGHWRLGMRGFLWSCLNAIAEFLRLAKAWENRHAPRISDPPAKLYRPPIRSVENGALADRLASKARGGHD